MASLTVYILGDDDSILATRTGDVDSILYALDVEKSKYTIQKPPTYHEKWYWYNNQWNDKPSLKS